MSQEVKFVGNMPEFYERELVPAIFGEWVPRVIALATPQPGDRVLDVACGTGIVARRAAEDVGPGGTVVGLDLSPGMLAVARSAPSRIPIEWHEGRAESMPFADAMFTIVYCQAGLMLFPDKPAALREMHRVLVPGGRLGLLVWGPIQHSPGFTALRDALERHVSAEANAFMQLPFALGEAQEFHALIAGAGFHDVMVRPAVGTVRFPSTEQFVRTYVAATPLADLVAKVDEDARAALLRDVSTALVSYESAGGLAFPIEGNLASAKK